MTPTQTPQWVFHLAIPVYDLEETEDFYVEGLGCRIARRYSDRITLDFFGDQVVCHLQASPHIQEHSASGLAEPIADFEEKSANRPIETLNLYPRHFGITFRDMEDFTKLYDRAINHEIPFFQKISTRFDGRIEVHQTFVIVDPSDNLIEFKHYSDPEMMY